MAVFVARGFSGPLCVVASISVVTRSDYHSEPFAFAGPTAAVSWYVRVLALLYVTVYHSFEHAAVHSISGPFTLEPRRILCFVSLPSLEFA